MFTKDWHLLKAQLPMLVSVEGKVTSVRPVQPPKALSLMTRSPAGSVTWVRPVHSLKAFSPMVVTANVCP